MLVGAHDKNMGDSCASMIDIPSLHFLIGQIEWVVVPPQSLHIGKPSALTSSPVFTLMIGLGLHSFEDQVARGEVLLRLVMGLVLGWMRHNPSILH